MKDEKGSFRCLLCQERVPISEADAHEQESHPEKVHYGFMWYEPDLDDLKANSKAKDLYSEDVQNARKGIWSTQESPLLQALLPTDWRSISGLPLLTPSRMYPSSLLAASLGVKQVYIRDEGSNPSGSMKDYMILFALADALEKRFTWLTAVSTGNHANALAMFSNVVGGKALLFVPSSSAKIPLLVSYPNTFVVGMKDAIFEDVYEKCGNLGIAEIYNCNVSNELLIESLKAVAIEIAALMDVMPTHILAPVGNGTYIGGVGKGFLEMRALGLITQVPKMIPIGMKGAFPLVDAYQTGSWIVEYNDFKWPESEIELAEGSIACGSYSMPQAINSVHQTKGFPLGELTHWDLSQAYQALAQDPELVQMGAIPEPTGIMSLAAALRHRESFSENDILMLVFTGHGSKDLQGVRELVPGRVGAQLETAIRRGRPDLISRAESSVDRTRYFEVERNVSKAGIIALARDILSKER